MMNALDADSTRPYLIRALYEWCSDNGLTPYIAVLADDTVQVPREYVQNGEIVLNISYDATSGLQLGNEFVEFKARFGGVPREIVVPVNRVIAIYARENGQGMAFPVAASLGAASADEGIKGSAVAPSPSADDAQGQGRPGIQLVTSPEAAAPPGAGEAPEDPPPTRRTRPALKRVK